jgi:hypothetical protein
LIASTAIFPVIPAAGKLVGVIIEKQLSGESEQINLL